MDAYADWLSDWHITDVEAHPDCPICAALGGDPLKPGPVEDDLTDWTEAEKRLAWGDR